jgi:uncharacterized protein YbbC (DUF1343 family)
MSLRSDSQPNNVGELRTAHDRALILLAVIAALLNPAARATASQGVLPGIDVWQQRGYAPLVGKRIGLITNVTGKTADGRSTVTILAAASELELLALFSPEHSFFANQEGNIDASVHAATGLPLHSLYGETRRPTATMLEGLDALVFDIQDIGTRIYTYASTLAYCMEEAAAAGIPIVVLDRPNPIGGIAVSGPVLDEKLRSFVGYATIPVRHGMTIGELALYFNGELAIGADLTVIGLVGWQREMWFDQTGLEWINPSPNMREPRQALLYPALGPLEWTNISVGRGTAEPFEWFGAPWIDGADLAAALEDAALPGLRVAARRLTPSASVYADRECGGVYLEVTDRNVFDAGLTLATIATSLQQLYGVDWERQRLVPLWGDDAIDRQLDTGVSAAAIVTSWEHDLATFRAARARYLLYD